MTSPLRVAGKIVDRDRLADICERHGVSEHAVFGSVARGDSSPNSDVDLLFELQPSARLGFALFNFEAELEEAIGRPVDLLSKDSIPELIRAAVLSEAPRSMQRDLSLRRGLPRNAEFRATTEKLLACQRGISSCD